MSDPSASPASKPNPFRGRSFHRGRQHDSAHNDTAAPPSAAHPRHAARVPKGPAALITEQPQLDELVAHLRASPRFAYDTEFIGELTYTPKLCVIQVASESRVALIDPLAPIDLRGFWELLCDPSIEKILHAGQQDIEPVFRHVGKPAANIFDTQIAAGFVSMSYPVALSKLVLELTGAKLGKGLTFTHWDQRPLSAMQLRYAADDVRYLLAVRHEIGLRLEEAGVAPWAHAECLSLCDPSQYRFDPDSQYLRIRGCGTMSPTGLAVLRELTIWRDGCARQHDVPARTFLRDEILADLARMPLKSVEQLARVRGLPRPVESAYGPQIIEATRRAQAMPPAHLASVAAPEPSPVQRFRVDALWALVQSLSVGRGIDPALVASRQEIAELSRTLDDSNGSGEPPRLFSGWRHEAIGRHLQSMLSGRAGVTLRWSEGAAHATFDDDADSA